MASPCVSCGAAQPDPPPRFCDSCGLAIQRVMSAAQRAAYDPPRVRCGECGVFATTRRCRACGRPVRWPEDMVPLEEELGKPAAPDLELPPGDEGEDVDMADDENP